MSTATEVKAASAAFYAALNAMANGDAAPMADAWIGGPEAMAQHPIGGRDRGHDTVVSSFANVAGLAGGGEIALTGQIIDTGADLAVETGIESGWLVIAGQRAEIEHRVTNVYRRGPEGWKLQHHHTDLSPGMVEIVRGLQTV